jgi:hypothetical protein
MTFDLYVIAVTERGVQCALDGDNSPAFWLPRQAVEWHGALDPGELVHATVPRWLASKHKQLVAVRNQLSISFQAPIELDPIKANAEGSFPMADQSNDNRGALFRIPDDEKKNDKWPDMRGDITIDGVKWRLAGWVKEGKKGKYLSLAAKPADEQPQRQDPPANAYAQATGRPAERQRQVDDEIPF